jgi:hypothetical protein
MVAKDSSWSRSHWQPKSVMEPLERPLQRRLCGARRLVRSPHWPSLLSVIAAATWSPCPSSSRYNARKQDQLTLLKGQKLRVIQSDAQWWVCQTQHGEIGKVPSNFVKVISGPSAERAAALFDGASDHASGSGRSNGSAASGPAAGAIVDDGDGDFPPAAVVDLEAGGCLGNCWPPVRTCCGIVHEDGTVF